MNRGGIMRSAMMKGLLCRGASCKHFKRRGGHKEEVVVGQVAKRESSFYECFESW